MSFRGKMSEKTETRPEAEAPPEDRNSPGPASRPPGSNGTPEQPDLFDAPEAGAAGTPAEAQTGGDRPPARKSSRNNSGARGAQKNAGGNGKPSARNGRPSSKKSSPRDPAGESADTSGTSGNSGKGDVKTANPSDGNHEAAGNPSPKKSRKEKYKERKEKERAREAAILEAAEPIESEGIVEISPKGFGFLREKKRGFNQSPKDVFITPEIVRIHGLRDGLWVKCVAKEGVRGPQLIELLQINGKKPEAYLNLPYFEELTAINPNKRLTLETKSTRATTRVIDLITPVGRGQRGLIVAPPRTGKTTLLQHIAEAIQENYEDMHLMILLIDERPEEVTDFERSFPDAEVLSSSNDGEVKDHTRIAMLAIERAKRLVEAGEHVFILMDSITRLARAFNNSMRGNGKRGTASGGLTVGALEMPRRIFAAARNTREAGSLTILATALIQTNSKADEAIFQEFKGTGNMELVLDRILAQNYVYPAVDINRSGTRREELRRPPPLGEKIEVMRRGRRAGTPIDSMQWLLRCLEKYPSNAQMLMDIKRTALS